MSMVWQKESQRAVSRGTATITREGNGRYQVAGRTAKGAEYVAGGLTRQQANQTAANVRAGKSIGGEG